MKTFKVQLEMTSDIEIMAETEEEALTIASEKVQSELRPQFNGCLVLVLPDDIEEV